MLYEALPCAKMCFHLVLMVDGLPGTECRTASLSPALADRRLATVWKRSSML